jgi:hypothetical protein
MSSSWHDTGNNPFVTVTAGHFVTRLQLAFDCNEDLHHLHHARQQFVAALQFFDLVFKTLFQIVDRRYRRSYPSLRFLASRLRSLNDNLTPQATLHCIQHQRFLVAFFQALSDRATVLPTSNSFRRPKKPSQGSALVVTVFCKTFDFRAFDRHRTGIFINAAAVEHAHFNDRADAPGGNRSDVSFTSEAFSPKIARSNFSSGVIGRFAFWRHLTHQNVTRPSLRRRCKRYRLHQGASAPSSPTFGMSRVISSVAQFGIARHDFEFFDVDRGENVVTHDTFGDQDGVFEVVTVPRHEGDQNVTAQRQFTELGRRTVGNDIAGLDLIAHFDQRTSAVMQVTGSSVGTLKFVDINAGFRARDFLVARITIRVASTCTTIPERRAAMAAPESRATVLPCLCRPAAHRSAAAERPDACMFDPISARFASSFSRNGISAAATETICFGETSIISIWSGGDIRLSPALRQDTRSDVNLPFSSRPALA